MHQLLKHRWPDFLLQIGLVLIYASLTGVALNLFSVNGNVIVAWPPGWLALAVLLIGGRKYAPGIFIGTSVSFIMMGNSAGISILMACGSTLGAYAGAYVLARNKRFSSVLMRPSDYLRLGVAAGISGGISALIGTAILLSAGLLAQQTFTADLLNWWKGDAFGVILVTPIILAWRRVPRDWFQRERAIETITFLGLGFFAGQIIFLGWFQDVLENYAKAFLMFAFVAWGAARFSRQGALLVIGMTGIQALLGAINGVGFFAQDIAQTNLTNLWFYMLVLTGVGIALDRVIHELRHAEAYEHSRNRVLELLAKGTPLRDILQFIMLVVEQEEKLLCCIQLKENKADNLVIGTTPNLPDYSDANACADQTAVSSNSFSAATNTCGRVMADGVETVSYRTCLNEFAILPPPGACLSMPVMSSYGKELGTFSFYGSDAPPLCEDDIKTIDQYVNLVGFAIDQNRANEERHLALMVFQNSSEAIMVTNAKDFIVTINPAFTRLTGYTLDEVIGRNPSILSSGRQNPDFYQAFWQAINSTGRWQGEIWNRRKNGEIYAEWLAVNTVHNDDGSIHSRVALFSDITQKKELDELVWRQANFDALTGLPNRRMFHDRLEQELRKAHRAGLPLALLFLDLDRFKEVNDTLGHGMGDVLLKEVAQRLSGCVRESDTVARLGGDEFTVILGELNDPDSVDRVSQDILRELASPFRLGEEVVFLSASIGITLYPADATEIESLLKNADQAMFTAKSLGRNRSSYFTPAMQDATQARMRLVKDLHRALSDDQFLVFYQPIVELATGVIRKAEALIRWEHPERNLISPAEFIPVAEETGLIEDIGDWVFREAIHQSALWRASLHDDFQISINKSPVQFHSTSNTHVNWLEYLQSHGFPGQSIVVEITEGLLLDAGSTVTDQLLELRNAGIQISLDDFGTGYSSLSYLSKFNIDYLKIDQSFVRNLTPVSSNMALCEAIIAMAHKLGIKVIAEGVEMAEQRDLLAAAGCDYGQGYLFSRPVPPEEFEKLF